MARVKLGRYLEWHGDRIRAVVKISPSLQSHFGKTKLKETLPEGTTPRHAEVLKWEVVTRLKRQIHDAKSGAAKDTLTDEALKLREARRTEAPFEYIDDQGQLVQENLIDDAIVARAEAVETAHGEATAKAFADIAFGRKTPLRAQLVQMFERGRLGVGYQQDIERAIDRLETWCEKERVPPVIESVNVETASRYIHQQFVLLKVHHRTANKDISALSSYWKSLKKLQGIKGPNPWAGLRLEAPPARLGVRNDKKRPFTDDEAAALLSGLALKRDWEFSMVAALSGMRENEIAALTVADCQGDTFNITKSKTPAGVRKVPIHPALRAVIAARLGGKTPAAFLFDELPSQRPGSKRERGAVIAQSFTRERRRLGIDERSDGQRQSNVDFHSWRRWFVSKAVAAIEKGAKGYTVYTIAHVVGHRIEGSELEGVRLPLGITMGVYAGAPSEDSLRACVAAVQLPPAVPRGRSDLQPRRKGGRRPARPRAPATGPNTRPQ
jgi:integrase